MQACRAGGGRGSRASASSAAPRTGRRVGRSGAASAAADPVQCSGRVRACVRACVAVAPCAVPALTGRRKRATTPGCPRAATVGTTGGAGGSAAAGVRRRGGAAGRAGRGTHHGRHAEVVTDGHDDLDDLRGQLAGRREDQRLAVAVVQVDVLQQACRTSAARVRVTPPVEATRHTPDTPGVAWTAVAAVREPSGAGGAHRS